MNARGSEMSEWIEIDKLHCVDGDVVIGWGEYRERDGFEPAFMRFYSRDSGLAVKGWYVNGMPFYPTHWLPLPKPPKPNQ